MISAQGSCVYVTRCQIESLLPLTASVKLSTSSVMPSPGTATTPSSCREAGNTLTVKMISYCLSTQVCSIQDWARLSHSLTIDATTGMDPPPCQHWHSMTSVSAGPFPVRLNVCLTCFKVLDVHAVSSQRQHQAICPDALFGTGVGRIKEYRFEKWAN